MQQRQLAPSLQLPFAGFPAVLITVPRQSGKTSFLKHEAGEQVDFISFGDPLERDFATVGPTGFLGRFAHRPVILDEISAQTAIKLPELPSTFQSTIAAAMDILTVGSYHW